MFDREIISRLPSCHHVLRSISGTYTTACTGSSEFISFIGQANNGVACLSHVESGAPRMRIDIQKAEHETRLIDLASACVSLLEYSGKDEYTY